MAGLSDDTINIDFPKAFQPLFRPARYKVYWGGRGGAKSWAFARALLLQARMATLLILCARELQNSIADSVYRLLVEQSKLMGIADEFDFRKAEIVHKRTGSRFIFKGIRHNIEEIKSTEGVDICWVEEASRLTKKSLDILFPTIRKAGSEIWLSYNVEDETDAVHNVFVINNEKPTDAVVVKVGWQDNPWFSEELNRLRLDHLRTQPELYDWIWEGGYRPKNEHAVFSNWTVDCFESPPLQEIHGARNRFRFGLDWGFGESDPCAGVRAFTRDDTLYIDHEFYEFQAPRRENGELREGRSLKGLGARIAQALPGIQRPDQQPYGDSARPDTIRYLNEECGYNILPCTKGKNSIEEGIAYLQAFTKIVIHERCRETINEFKLYQYQVKMTTDEVTRKPMDKYNHCIDSLRYGFDEEIHGNRPITLTNDFLNAWANARMFGGLR